MISLHCIGGSARSRHNYGPNHFQKIRKKLELRQLIEGELKVFKKENFLMEKYILETSTPYFKRNIEEYQQ